MTQEESVRPFAMLHANWPFLDFSDTTTAGIWYAALKPYHEAEVRQGIQDAIANIQKTQPVVADILDFVKAVHEGTRRRQAEQNQQRTAAAVSCWNCNDYGFINIVYPNGDEAVRPCNCSKAEQAFGKNFMEKTKNPEPLPAWKTERLFGKNEIPSQYKLVRVTRRPVPTGEKIKDPETGAMMDRYIFGFVPYFNDGGRREVWMQYQKQERRRPS